MEMEIKTIVTYGKQSMKKYLEFALTHQHTHNLLNVFNK